ncbi:MAG: glycosyltransferase [Treponema sp.]|nr:glycosyltransferase [Treponema sp.]
MRIAFLSDSYWPRVNGVSVSIQTFASELARRGHAVVILCPEYPEGDGGIEESDQTGPTVYRFPSSQSVVSTEDRIVHVTAFPAIFYILDRFRPDVIYSQTEFAMQVAGRLFARRRGLPFVLCSHTDYEHYIANYITTVDGEVLRATVRFLFRRVFGTADAVVTPSHAMERLLLGYGIYKPIHVIPSGISPIFKPLGADEIESHRAALMEQHPALAGRRILLFAGRVTEEKNTDFLVPLMKRLLAERGDLALLVVGDGPHRAALEEHVRAEGLADRVAFTGYMGRAELPLVYAAGDVFVFPSKTETLGLCTLEAMAVGTPVVAIGEMGTRDIMRGDHGGFMVRDDLEEFALAVLRLLGDEELRRSKSAEAILWAEAFSIGGTTDRLVDFLERIVRRGTRRAARLRALKWSRNHRRAETGLG